ncbi:hypothetical protein GOV05_03445 [Candidatus Woesearchaeota archaeon]|nr:hypothetical protein [Candidatus Woesearchaeota archaeon]
MDGRGLYKKIKEYAPESTALSVLALPLYAFIETELVGMSSVVSFKSRLFTTLGNYVSVPLFMGARDYTKDQAGINKETSEENHTKHDRVFAAVSATIVKPFVYRVLAGETDWEKIMYGTLATTAASVVLGPAALKFMDYYKYLIRDEHPKRNFEILKNKESVFRRRVAFGLVAASLALTTTIYTASINNLEGLLGETNQSSVIEIKKEKE